MLGRYNSAFILGSIGRAANMTLVSFISLSGLKRKQIFLLATVTVNIGFQWQPSLTGQTAERTFSLCKIRGKIYEFPFK